MIISVEFNKGNDGLEKQTKQSIESLFLMISTQRFFFWHPVILKISFNVHVRLDARFVVVGSDPWPLPYYDTNISRKMAS